MTATASDHGSAAGPPKFTLCPSAHRRTCSIGDLSANQAIEVRVTNHIGKTAAVGEQITLTVTVDGVGLSPAEAAITAVVGAVKPSPTSTSSAPPPLPTTGPVPFPVVQPRPTLTPDSLNTLFPTVTPGPTVSPPKQSKSNRVTAATQASSTLPLDPRLIGGQLAGLAVLAAAVTLVVARLSLRQAAPGGPAVPADPSPPSGETAVDPADPEDDKPTGES